MWLPVGRARMLRQHQAALTRRRPEVTYSSRHPLWLGLGIHVFILSGKCRCLIFKFFRQMSRHDMTFSLFFLGKCRNTTRHLHFHQCMFGSPRPVSHSRNEFRHCIFADPLTAVFTFHRSLRQAYITPWSSVGQLSWVGRTASGVLRAAGPSNVARPGVPRIRSPSTAHRSPKPRPLARARLTHLSPSSRRCRAPRIRKRPIHRLLLMCLIPTECKRYTHQRLALASREIRRTLAWLLPSVLRRSPLPLQTTTRRAEAMRATRSTYPKSVEASAGSKK